MKLIELEMSNQHRCAWSEQSVKNGICSSWAQYFVRDDGGRADAGYKGDAGDCVTRAIAIATGLPYNKVYADLNELAKLERTRKQKKSNSRMGVHRALYEKYLKSIGWIWTPLVKIGSGCTTHLRGDELPTGRIICRVTRHIVAVIDGVIHDAGDCSRQGTRCVYGYFKKLEL